MLGFQLTPIQLHPSAAVLDSPLVSEDRNSGLLGESCRVDSPVHLAGHDKASVFDDLGMRPGLEPPELHCENGTFGVLRVVTRAAAEIFNDLLLMVSKYL